MVTIYLLVKAFLYHFARQNKEVFKKLFYLIIMFLPLPPLYKSSSFYGKA